IRLVVLGGVQQDNFVCSHGFNALKNCVIKVAYYRCYGSRGRRRTAGITSEPVRSRAFIVEYAVQRRSQSEPLGDVSRCHCANIVLRDEPARCRVVEYWGGRIVYPYTIVGWNVAKHFNSLCLVSGDQRLPKALNERII